MIAAHAFTGRTVAVFGLARTGLPAVRSLLAGGAHVIAWDDNSAARDTGSVVGAEIMPWREWPWERIAALILSPGVPLTHPRPHEVVAHAKAAKAAVIGDVELFALEIRADAAKPGLAPVIAITGTNGKSTTTALIGHILNAAGFDAQIGGNIGTSVLELSPPGPRTIYVLEMSSFQIDLTPGLKPDIALLSNLSPDHLDRHGSFENYAAIKQRLLNQVRWARWLTPRADLRQPGADTPAPPHHEKEVLERDAPDARGCVGHDEVEHHPEHEQRGGNRARPPAAEQRDEQRVEQVEVHLEPDRPEGTAQR